MKIEAVNESSTIVYLGDIICDEVADQVKRASDLIRKELSDVLIDLIPSYTSVLVIYDLNRVDRLGLEARLHQLLDSLSEVTSESSEPNKVLELPVYYGDEVALDLADVSEHTGLSAEEVIRVHSDNEYRVYAIGFTPGFAYLGNTDKRITIGRKSTPRLKVPTGSVGIADNQTAIYPSVTPGGWQIIGRTPVKLIDWQSDSLTPFEVGDMVRFIPITRQEFLDQGGQLDEL